MSQGSTTTNHSKIRRWAEARGGRPARVKDTGHSNDDPGLLRFDFGETDERLEEISWEDFFEKFEESKLALIYDDKKDSRFNKFVQRDRA